MREKEREREREREEEEEVYPRVFSLRSNLVKDKVPVKGCAGGKSRGYDVMYTLGAQYVHNTVYYRPV